MYLNDERVKSQNMAKLECIDHMQKGIASRLQGR
jgi:hypothetical protein